MAGLYSTIEAVAKRREEDLARVEAQAKMLRSTGMDCGKIDQMKQEAWEEIEYDYRRRISQL